MLKSGPIRATPPTVSPTSPSWPSGTPPFLQGRWPSKGLAFGPYYTSRVWWLDNRGALHWVSTANAMNKYFGEQFYTNTNTAFTGVTGNSNTTGYLIWLADAPVGANIDDVTTPAAAIGKSWSYNAAPQGGNVLIASNGSIWWAEPSSYFDSSTMHRITNRNLCDKYWPNYAWRYPPLGKWNITWQDLDKHPIGPNIDH